MAEKIVGFYYLQSKIGNGAFSEVYLGFDIRNSQKVAIKMIKLKKLMPNQALEEQISNQIEVMSVINESPYIIRFIDYMRTINNFYFVYEHCNQGTLEDLIRREKYLNEKEALKFFNQILEGFKTLVQKKVIHRDIKPENILLKDGRIKIADFGFCKLLKYSEDNLMSMVGSPKYMAPQIVYGDNYTSKCDIYSLGVVLYKMLYGVCPNQGNCIIQILNQLKNTQLSFPENIKVSLQTKKLLTKLLQKDDNLRPNWDQVFKDCSEMSQQSNIEVKLILLQNLQLKSENSLIDQKSNSSFASYQTAVTNKMFNYQQEKQAKQEVHPIQLKNENNKLIKQLIVKHYRILEIVQVIVQVGKFFPKQKCSKLLNYCIAKMNKQLTFLKDEFSGIKQSYQICEMLKEHLNLLGQMKLEIKLNNCQLLQLLPSDIIKLVQDLFVSPQKLQIEIQQINQQKLILAVRLIDLFVHNIVGQKQDYIKLNNSKLFNRIYEDIC